MRFSVCRTLNAFGIKMEMKTQFHTVEDGGLRTQMVEIMREMVALSTLMKLRIGIE